MFDRPLFQGRLWTARQAGDITHAQLAVGLVLSRYANRRGCCWPSMATLAAGSGSCERTVQRAVNRMRELGLLTWRSEWGRWNRRESNRYTLLIPEKPSAPKRKTPLRGFPARMSGGSAPKPAALPPGLAEALTRLGRAMLVQPERLPEVPPASGAPPPTPR